MPRRRSTSPWRFRPCPSSRVLQEGGPWILSHMKSARLHDILIIRKHPKLFLEPNADLHPRPSTLISGLVNHSRYDIPSTWGYSASGTTHETNGSVTGTFSPLETGAEG